MTTSTIRLSDISPYLDVSMNCSMKPKFNHHNLSCFFRKNGVKTWINRRVSCIESCNFRFVWYGGKKNHEKISIQAIFKNRILIWIEPEISIKYNFISISNKETTLRNDLKCHMVIPRLLDLFYDYDYTDIKKQPVRWDIKGVNKPDDVAKFFDYDPSFARKVLPDSIFKYVKFDKQKPYFLLGDEDIQQDKMDLMKKLDII